MARSKHRRTFIKEIKPLLWAFRILGWLPAVVDSRTGLLTFQLNSKKQIIYFIVVHLSVIISTGISFYFSMRSVLRSTESFPFLEYLKAFGSPATTFIGAWFAMQSKQIVDFLNDITTIQVSLSSRKIKKWKSPARPARIGLVVGALSALGVLFTPLLNVPVNSFSLTVAIAFICIVLSVTWWVCIFRAIANISEMIYQDFQHSVIINRPHSDLYITISTLLVKNFGLVERAGSVSALAMVWTPILSFSLMLFCIYELAGYGNSTEAVVFIFYTLLFGSMILVSLCEAPHLASRKIMKVSLAFLDTLKKSGLQRPCPSFIKLLKKICKKPPKVTFYSFFGMDRSLYVELFPALISLLVVLKQLNIQVKPLKLIDFFTLG